MMNNREEENLTFSQLFEHASRQPEFRKAIKEQKQEENLADMIANLPQATPKSAQEVLDLHGHTVEESKAKVRQFVFAGRVAGL
jgi:DNA-nicking Smr family endonuclease